MRLEIFYDSSTHCEESWNKFLSDAEPLVLKNQVDALKQKWQVKR